MKKALLLLVSFVSPVSLAGGLWRADSSNTALAPPTAAQIASFLPKRRGPFRFPAPYDTTGIRVTLPSDCKATGQTDCVQYIGYSYWARMNNSAGSSRMYIVVGLGTNGKVGPTLYSLNKTTNAVTRVGPLFRAGSIPAWSSGETDYFSHSIPTRWYYLADNALDYMDVVTRKTGVVFKASDYKTSDHIFQCSTDNDDVVSVCTLEDAHYHPLGCVVYDARTKAFKFFASMEGPGGFDECHISATGRYVLIDERTPQTCSRCDEDTVIEDLHSGKQTIIDNKDGGGGHYATGYGYYTQAMNWDNTYDETMLWKFSDLAAGGRVVWAESWHAGCPRGCGAGGPQHPTWLNAVPASRTAIARQYECDGTSNPPVGPGDYKAFSDVVYCYFLDPAVPRTRMRSLIVAPTMINMSKRGCGPSAYDQYPKGNIDPTGHYYIWSANLDSNDDCEVFISVIPVATLAAG